MFKPDSLALTTLLGLLSAIGPLSTDMYLPSMPDIAVTLRASTAQVQLTISCYLIGFALGQIVYGPLSDRYGRKPVPMVAVSLYCVATALCTAATSIELLIAARGLQALGGCGAIVLARAIVRDLYVGARAGREMAVIAMVMALAPLVAPLIGGVLQTWFGWRAVFVVQMLIGLEAVAMVWWFLPETLQHRAAEQVSPLSVLRSYRVIARDRSYLAHLGLVTLAYSGLFVWLSGSSFVLQDLYGLAPTPFGVVFALGSLGFLAGTALAARFVVRSGLGAIIGAGCVALAAGGLIMAAVTAAGLAGPLTLVGGAAVYLLGLGLMLPQATAAALMPFPQRAGAASSLVGFVQQTVASVSGALVGMWLGASAWPLAAPMALFGCAALLLWALTRRVRAAVTH